MYRKQTELLQSSYTVEAHKYFDDTVNDQTVVHFATLGNRSAHAELFNRYKKKIYFICLQYCSGDQERAHDCSQEAFISAFLNLDNLRRKSQFLNWLIEIARNKCMSSTRKLKLNEKIMKDYEVIGQSEEDHSQRFPESMYQQVELFIAEIRNRDVKETVELFYIEGKKVSEISQIQEISQTVITTRLNRFRTAFRKKIFNEILKQQKSEL